MCVCVCVCVCVCYLCENITFLLCAAGISFLRVGDTKWANEIALRYIIGIDRHALIVKPFVFTCFTVAPYHLSRIVFPTHAIRLFLVRNIF